ncbi:MAG: Fe-S cluster assembly protein SufD [Bacillota bacterium]|nr:Fe-S cluster assembly protein SufD [Bacillota bacterium]
MSNALKNINSIPVRTWRWLGVNDTSLKGSLPEIRPYNNKPVEEVYSSGLRIVDIKHKNGAVKLFDNNSEVGISEVLTEMVRKNFNTGFLIESEKDSNIEEPVYINYEMDEENPHVIDNNVIVAEEGSRLTVVIRYSSNKDMGAFHSGITRLYAKKGAVINLIKVQMLEDDSIHLDGAAALVEEGAEVNYTLVELGAQAGVTNYKNELVGNGSRCNLSSIYLGDKDRQIDINYFMNHTGKESESNIRTYGALMDKSSKIFRGTIDFKKGCSGSKGKEEEYAVLLSKGVRNRSVPLLLCGEDNVQGQHAASTGKIDEDKLFYLMSRGFSEVEAKKLIIEASFNPVTEGIPVVELREEIAEYIRRRLTNV